ncbi:hypothetical protein FQZ97_1053510 [compost metagenome]
MAEHAGQADHLQRAVVEVKAVALGERFEVGHRGRLLDIDLPQLAMAGAVELARRAEGDELLGGTFDTGAFLADQVQRLAGQARGEGGQQVVGQFAGFRQEHHGAVEARFGWRHVEPGTSGEAGFQGRMLAGVPAPAAGLGQLAQQVVSGEAGQ